MKPLITKIQPTDGFAKVAHILLAASLPIVVYVLVRIDIPQAALAVILLSKWRMLAVRFRFWLAHIRTNSVDIIMSLSFLVFMIESQSATWMIAWTALFIIWLLFIKPASQTIMVGLQAMLSFSFGIVALFVYGGEWPLFLLVLMTALICYSAAHHFFDAFEERYTRLLASIWAWFGAGLVWVLGHWLLYYGDNLIAQPALLLISIGYGVAALYYLDHKDKLTPALARQFIFIMVATTVIILTFSDWGDKIV